MDKSNLSNLFMLDYKFSFLFKVTNKFISDPEFVIMSES